MEHVFKFQRTKDGKYETKEEISELYDALDVENYKNGLQEQINNLKEKIDELERGVKARQEMMLKINLQKKDVEADIKAFQAKQKTEVNQCVQARK